MHRHLELIQTHNLKRAPGHANKAHRQRAGRLGQQQRARENSPSTNTSADGQEPEEGDVEEVAVVVDVAKLAGEHDDRGENDEGED